MRIARKVMLTICKAAFFGLRRFLVVCVAASTIFCNNRSGENLSDDDDETERRLTIFLVVRAIEEVGLADLARREGV